ncbi:probable quinate 5-dehydrogenase QA-3 [Rhynchosporium secalis]|uniref:Probable quinate 5-dehydrogenase QA-3 n=1 Tax=Rhynchosporium secalis TaxID=38038 RepID=A0A1E1MUI2_RHYSE|nr:probable quinate 5-dehydrogenase QA-3 [Rhynchosporium secalis]
MSQSPGHTQSPLQEQTQTPPPEPSISHLDKVFYLFGSPIAHSLSPLLHSTVYASLKLNYAYLLYETPSISACLALTKSPNFQGAAVTMPHKVAIIPHLDVLTPEGLAIGAINTIFLRAALDGRRLLCGTNTDCIGIREAILQNTSPVQSAGMKGYPGMIIGGGGTCRAAVYALINFIGCEEVYLVNRDKSEVDAVIAECAAKGFGDKLRYVASIGEAEKLAAPRVVVSAIPDFELKNEDEIRARCIVEMILGKSENGALLEMCYHPNPDTAIARLAEKSGWNVIGGIEAMIWQGLEQDKIWLRRKASSLPVEEVRRVFALKETKARL